MFASSRLHPTLCISTHSLLCMVFLSVLIFSSCSIIPSKDNYITSFSAFVTDVKTHSATYTLDDWKYTNLLQWEF